MLRRDEDDVVSAFAGDGDIGHVQRLGVELAVDRIGKKFAESRGVDVCGSEDRFRSVCTGTRDVVVMS